MSDAIQVGGHYGTAEVARLMFDITVRTFYSRRRALNAEGFPKPISDTGLPRWRGADLLAWESRRPAEGALQGENLVDLRPILRQRSHQIAQTGRQRLSR